MLHSLLRRSLGAENPAVGDRRLEFLHFPRGKLTPGGAEFPPGGMEGPLSTPSV
jgi:hypothetical protein